MSYNLLNTKFLRRLRDIHIDLHQFPERTFDSLFDSRQSDVIHFLDWFIDNFGPENVLTEEELDSYYCLEKSGQCVDENELDVALSKYKPSYEEVCSIQDGQIKMGLTQTLEDLNLEFQKLEEINVRLEDKMNKLKRKPVHIKEECNKHKKRLTDIRNDLQSVNSNLTSLSKNIESFQITNNYTLFSSESYKNIFIEAEGINDLLEQKCFSLDQSPLLSNEMSTELVELRKNLCMSKYMNVLSKGYLDGTRHKTVKAEEFLDKLQNQSDSQFTFDDALIIWCDPNEVNSLDKMKKKISLLQSETLFSEIDKGCMLNWDHSLSQTTCYKTRRKEDQVAKLREWAVYVKKSVINDILLLEILNKSIEQEKECASLIKAFHTSLIDSENAIKDSNETLRWKEQLWQKHAKNLNENHALSLTCRKIFGESHSPGKVIDLESECNAVQLLMRNPNFYPVDFFNELDRAISSAMSVVVSGLTSQIQILPAALKFGFFTCKQLLDEYSHTVQRLLTEYLNVKESVASSDRRQLLLWVDFLKNPKRLESELASLQQETLKKES